MTAITFYDTASAAAKVERERQLLRQGIDPFANSIVRSVTAQDFAPPVGGERKFEITIKDLSTTPAPPPGVAPSQPATPAPRWTQPSEPQPQPTSFAAEVVNVIASRLGKRSYSRQSVPKDEPEPDPNTFAGQVALAIKRRRKGYPNPKPWSQPT